MRAHAIALFRDTFGDSPAAAASAPGRVNLIGEHTDYNGGPVLPIAIAERTTCVVAMGNAGSLDGISARDARRERITWESGPIPSGWTGYVVGVLRELAKLGAPLPGGVRLAVSSEVPVGAGVSSSAALTVSATRAFAQLAGLRLTPRAVAGIAYRAEHDHVGVRCGIMDQTISALGKPGHALLLECATGETQQIPFRARLLLVDTGVRHELAASAFNERRAQCEAALAELRKVRPELANLADWPVKEAGRLSRLLPPVLRARARHVVEESTRTRTAAGLLRRGSLRPFGRLLYASHDSCRTLYECSAPELDLLVRLARRGGALGARLTGAGWGGAVLVLVDGKGTERLTATLRAGFARAFGREPAIMEVRASGGARNEPIR